MVTAKASCPDACMYQHIGLLCWCAIFLLARELDTTVLALWGSWRSKKCARLRVARQRSQQWCYTKSLEQLFTLEQFLTLLIATSHQPLLPGRNLIPPPPSGHVDPRFASCLPLSVPEIPEFNAFRGSGKVFQHFCHDFP